VSQLVRKGSSAEAISSIATSLVHIEWVWLDRLFSVDVVYRASDQDQNRAGD